MNKPSKTINIALDTYDDLFSDFDISTFKNRAISLDFKENLESQVLDNYDCNLKINFSLPKNKRKKTDESIIETRLKQFFIFKQITYSKRINYRRLKGLRFIAMGLVFVTLTFFFETFFTDLLPLYLANIIMIFGWFGIWTGIEKVVDIPQELTNKKQMYTCFSNSKIDFINEEEIKN